MKLFRLFLATSFLVFLTSSSCWGDITSGIVTSNVNGIGGKASVTSGLSISSSLIKVSGGFELDRPTGLGGEFGSSTGNFLKIDGEFDLDPGEAFGLGYDFDVNLSGGGTVIFTTTATTQFIGETETLMDMQTIAEDGNYNLTFDTLGVVADESGSGTWNGEFTFDWIDVPAGASLTVTIPNNSIDFSVQSVPEPSSIAMVFALALGFVSRRTRS